MLKLKDKSIRFLSFGDAIFYSLMVGSGETFIVAFALANGVSEVIAGMASIVPMGIASVAQLWFLKLARRLGSPRRWVVACALMQGLSLFGLGILPYLGGFSVAGMFLISTMYWFFGLSAGPPWNAWIGGLVETSQHRRFFGYRSFFMQGATLLSLVVSAALLFVFSKKSSTTLNMFTVLFIFAATARCLSAWFLTNHPDIPGALTKTTENRISLKSLPQVSRPVLYGFLLTFTMSFSVYVSAPYFSPYLLKVLQQNYFEYGFLLAVVFIARMSLSFAQSNILLGITTQNVFLLGMIMIVPVPIFWTLSNNYYYLMALQAWSGFAWGAYELGLTLFLMENIDGKNRFAMLTWFNASSAVGMLLGMLVGWYLMGTKSPSAADYHVVFSVSSFLRVLPFFFLLPFLRAIRYHAALFSVIGVRAGGRSIVRPIFLPDETPEVSAQPRAEGGERTR